MPTSSTGCQLGAVPAANGAPCRPNLWALTRGTRSKEATIKPERVCLMLCPLLEGFTEMHACMYDGAR